MTTLISITGCAVLIGLSVAVAAAAVSVALDAAKKLTERWRWDVREVHAHEIGQRVMSASHWFGECPDVVSALELLGVAIRDRQSLYPGDGMRDEWRRRTGKIETQHGLKAERS